MSKPSHSDANNRVDKQPPAAATVVDTITCIHECAQNIIRDAQNCDLYTRSIGMFIIVIGVDAYFGCDVSAAHEVQGGDGVKTVPPKPQNQRAEGVEKSTIFGYF